MKVPLLHRDRDFDVKPALRDEMFKAMMSGNLFGLANARRNLERQPESGAAITSPTSDDALVADRELDAPWRAMAGADFCRAPARGMSCTAPWHC